VQIEEVPESKTMNTTLHQKPALIWRGRALLFLLCILSFLVCSLQSCVLEDMDHCTQYELTVRIVGTDGYELPSGTVDTVNMYLFNEDGFVRMVSTGRNSDFMFGYEKEETLTLVAWGNLKKDSLLVPTLVKGESLESALVALRKLEDYNLGATDLFYSRYTVHGDSAVAAASSSSAVSLRSSNASTDTLTLSLERMVASVSIMGKSMSERFGTDTTGYRFAVYSTKDALNFLGVPSGDMALYVPGTSMDALGQLVTSVIRVLPTPTDGMLTVALYRGNELLYSTCTDSDGNALQAVAGKQLNVVLDFRYSFVRVTVTVTPWGEVTQNTEL
jgi:hypothetical protein